MATNKPKKRVRLDEEFAVLSNQKEMDVAQRNKANRAELLKDRRKMQYTSLSGMDVEKEAKDIEEEGYGNLDYRSYLVPKRGRGRQFENLIPSAKMWEGKGSSSWLPESGDEIFGQEGLGKDQFAAVYKAMNEVAPLLKAKGKGAPTPNDKAFIAQMLRSMTNVANWKQDIQEKQEKQLNALARGLVRGLGDYAGGELSHFALTEPQRSALLSLIARYQVTKEPGAKVPLTSYISERAQLFGKDYMTQRQANQKILTAMTAQQRIPKSQKYENQDRLGSYNWQTYGKDVDSQINYNKFWAPSIAQGALQIARSRGTNFDPGATATITNLKNPRFNPGRGYAWDPQSAEWTIRDGWKGVVGNFTVKGATKSANTKALLGAQLTADEVQSFIPPIVRNLISSNAEFVKTGFGPVGKNSFPLYGGRYTDPLTGNVRTLPKPSSKYINPRNLIDVVRYYEARTIASWNSFVRTQQNLFSLYTKLRNGAYVKNLARKGRYMNKVDAGARLQGKAIKGLIHNILLGNDPYDMPRQIQEGAIQNYDAGRYREINSIVDQWGHVLQQGLTQAPQAQLLGTAIRSKYSNAFSKRGADQVQKYFKKVALPTLSKGGTILELYGPQIKGGYAKTMGAIASDYIKSGRKLTEITATEYQRTMSQAQRFASIIAKLRSDAKRAQKTMSPQQLERNNAYLRDMLANLITAFEKTARDDVIQVTAIRTGNPQKEKAKQEIMGPYLYAQHFADAFEKQLQDQATNHSMLSDDNDSIFDQDMPIPTYDRQALTGF